MVSCIRCKHIMYAEVAYGRMDQGTSSVNQITGFAYKNCGNWVELYAPAVVAGPQKIRTTPITKVIEPVVVSKPAVGLAVSYFENIASMLRSKASWQTIAHIISNACKAPVDVDTLQRGYDAEKVRRIELRLKNRKTSKAVAA